MKNNGFPKKSSKSSTSRKMYFRSHDKEVLKRAKNDAQNSMRHAKAKHRRKPEQQFSANNARTVWEGLKAITQYNQKSPVNTDDLSLFLTSSTTFMRDLTGVLGPVTKSDK